MSDTVIKVEKLSKEYRLGVINHGVLVHDLQSLWARLRGQEDPNSLLTAHQQTQHSANNKQNSELKQHFLALNQVSFEVKQGDVVGIIGRNGAGKSTLLKLLSRITSPSSGAIRIKGRIASLLEVGTGFHPELTGRENVYLNGAILGMRRGEIARKMDAIIAFAELEKFIDTPVKRYSSGMYVRLAFAIASHLDAEILILDEVLAVGDVQFQKKCLDKMQEISKNEGRTVLLVSHVMSSILALSTRCLWLNEGKLVDQGSPLSIVTAYQGNMSAQSLGRKDLAQTEHYGNQKAVFTSIDLKQFGNDLTELPFPHTGCMLTFETKLHAQTAIQNTTAALTIYDDLGNRLIDANTLIKGDQITAAKDQHIQISFTLKNVLLKPGIYTAGLWLGIINQEDIDGVRYATSFKIEPRQQDIRYTTPFPGVYACDFEIEHT